MKKKIIKRIFNDAPGGSDNESFGFGCGSILWLIFAIVLIFYPAAQDPDLYLTEAVVMGTVFFFRWLYLLFKKNRKINELKSLNNFVFNQLQANSYFSEYNDINSYFNKHILKSNRRNYRTFYENEVPISHELIIRFISSKLEEENKNWELLELRNCEINSNTGYEIIGELPKSWSASSSYDLITGNLRYNFGTPWYRKLFTRKADDNVIYALKERYDKEQKNKIILISKNELCLFNIIYTSQK